MNLLAYLKASGKKLLGTLSFDTVYCAKDYCSINGLKTALCHLAKRVPCTQRPIALADVRVALDDVKRVNKCQASALLYAKLPLMRAEFDRLSHRLQDVLLPSYEEETVLEAIARLLCVKTNLSFSKYEYGVIKGYACAVFDLSKTEKRLFDDVVEVFRTKLYVTAQRFCRVTRATDALIIYHALFPCASRTSSEGQECHGTYCGSVTTDGHSWEVYDDGRAVHRFRRVDTDGQMYTKRVYLNSLYNFSQMPSTYQVTPNNVRFYTSQHGIDCTQYLSFDGGNEIRQFVLRNTYNKSRKVRLLVQIDCHTSAEYYLSDNSVVLCSKDSCLGITLFDTKRTLRGDIKWENDLTCALSVTYTFTLSAKCEECLFLTFSHATDQSLLLDLLASAQAVGQTNRYYHLHINKCDNNASQSSGSFDSNKHAECQEASICNQITCFQSKISNLNYTVRPPKNSLCGTLYSTRGLSYLMRDGHCSTLSRSCATRPYSERVFLYFGNRFVELTGCIPVTQGLNTYYDYTDGKVSARLCVMRGCQKTFSLCVEPKQTPCLAVFALGFVDRHTWHIEADSIICNGLTVHTYGEAFIGKQEDFDVTCGAFSPAFSLLHRGREWQSDSLVIGQTFVDKVQITLSAPDTHMSQYTFFDNALCDSLNKHISTSAEKRHCRILYPDTFSLCAQVYWNAHDVFLTCKELYDEQFCIPYIVSSGEVKHRQDVYYWLCALLEYANLTGDIDLLTNHTQEIDDILRQNERTLPRLFCLKRMVDLSDNPLPYIQLYKDCLAGITDKQLIRAYLTGSLMTQSAIELTRRVCTQSSYSDISSLCNKCDLSREWGYLCTLANVYGITFKKGVMHLRPTAKYTLPSLSVRVLGKTYNIDFVRSASHHVCLNGVVIEGGITLFGDGLDSYTVTAHY